MKFEIKPLSPDVLDDFLYFFDNIEFQDHPEWSVCYCYSFHYIGPAAEWHNREKNRSSVIKLINENYMHGYLAYEDEKPIGWCNANDKLNFERLKLNSEIWDSDKHKICSVVCFLIDPKQRGKGIASKLLDRVCVDYEKLGYDYIEAYPIKNQTTNELQCQGPPSMYQNFNFKLVKDYSEHSNEYSIVRKKLK